MMDHVLVRLLRQNVFFVVTALGCMFWYFRHAVSPLSLQVIIHLPLPNKSLRLPLRAYDRAVYTGEAPNSHVLLVNHRWWKSG